MHDLEKLRPDLASEIVAAAQAGEIRRLKDLIDRAEQCLRMHWYVPPFARTTATPDADALAKKSIASFVQRLPSLAQSKIRTESRSIEEFISATKANIIHENVKDGCLGIYRPGPDCIAVLPKHQFPSISEYYSTLFHELVHWTQPRLKRPTSSSEEEELVAETGSFLLCERFKLKATHTSYIDHQLSLLSHGKMEVWTRAAKKAEEAVAYLLAL